jgi:membrane associated rhomboid family serine protease
MLAQLLQAPITLALLALNVGISLYAFSSPGIADQLSFRPYRIRERGEYHRFLTAGFIHGGTGHLFVNMLTLFFFGPLLERILGPGAYLVLYFGAEIAAHALTYAYHRDDPQYAAVGASGAISGVVFAFCVFFPLEKLYLFFALPIPAILFAFGYVFGSIYAMRAERGGMAGMQTGIAHEAHIGGAVAGVLLTILLDPRSVQSFVRSFEQLLG